MARHQSVHDLPVKAEGLQHFRIDLAPHAIDVIAVCDLEFVCADAVMTDGSCIGSYAYGRQISQRDIQCNKTHAEYKDEDHPDPFQVRLLAPHEIQHKQVSSKRLMLPEIG